MSTKKLLCVLNTFYNYEHIVKCFESIYHPDYDYFILENKSKYSNKIRTFFEKKNIIGYLQFQENISHGSVDTFVKDNKELISSYEYFTLTDGDLYIDNIEQTYNEIFGILEEPNVLVCTTDLSIENLPVKRFPESVNWIPKSENVNNKYLRGHSGTHLLTLKKNNLDIIFEQYKILDNKINQSVQRRAGVWAKTLVNKAYHLTWDYYVDGHEYLTWKLQNQWSCYSHNKTSEYIKII
jgi:hypothetical protein